MRSSPDTVPNLRHSSVTFLPNETILRQDSVSETIGSLRAGWAYSFRILPNGRRHVQGFFLPGDVLVLDLLQIGPMPVSVGVRALTSANVCWFPAPSMRRLLFENRAQRRETQYWMAYYILSLNHRAAATAQNSAISSLAEFLKEIVERLKHRKLTRGEGYDFPPTQEQIAECLGLTPVHVNRVMQELRKRGVAEVRNKTLYIYNEAELSALADGKVPMRPDR